MSSPFTKHKYTDSGYIHGCTLSHRNRNYKDCQGTETPTVDSADYTKLVRPIQSPNVPRSIPRGGIRLQKLLKILKNHIHITTNDLVGGKYPHVDHVSQIIANSGKKHVVVAHDLGGGKTEFNKLVRDKYYGSCGAGLSHRVALTNQIANRINAVSYEDIKAGKDGKGAQYQRLSSTVHSIDKLVGRDDCQQAFSGVLALDETESVASEFLQTTIKNEAQTLNAIRQACEKSSLTLAMDAHAGLKSLALLNAAGVPNDDILLITTGYQSLVGYRALIYKESDNNKTPVKTNFLGSILDDLAADLKVIVTSLSKNALDELERLVKSKFGDVISYIKVTSDTSANSESRALNADNYHAYQLVMLSPSLSTGASFDKNNADKSYCIVINARDTGTPYDALQAMLRDRKVKSGEINIYYQDLSQTLSNEHKMALEWSTQKDHIDNFISTLSESDQQRFAATRPHLDETVNLLRVVATEDAAAKQDFLQILESELTAKGAEVIHCDPSQLNNDTLTPQERKEAKQAAKAEELQAIIDAPRLTANERIYITSISDTIEKADAIDQYGLHDEPKKKAALTRYKIEHETTIDLTALPPKQAEKLIAKATDGELIHNLREWDIARATEYELKRVQKAVLAGVHTSTIDTGAFTEKLSSDRVTWVDRGHYGKMLLAAMGVNFDSNGMAVWDGNPLITAKTLKSNGGAWYQACNKTPMKVIKCGLLPIDTMAVNLKSNLLEHTRKAAERYGIKWRKVRGSDDYAIDADSMDAVIGMVNSRKARGVDAVAERIRSYDDYIQRHTPPNIAEPPKETAKEKGLVERVISDKITKGNNPTWYRKQQRAIKENATSEELWNLDFKNNRNQDVKTN